MPKLKRFKKNKISTKNVLISFAIIIGLLTIGYISKSYAIYKLQQDYDLIKNKIGSFTMGDVRVAVLVDGKEASEFPSYETNYKVEGIECTNGVTATFDVENWQINIADMSSTSTKCTVSFNSKETNETTPINYTKSELVALNESMTDTFKSSLKKELLNETYPVGSIYMSTSDDTVEKVQNKFGGTWVRYAEDTTLVGYKENTNEVNTTGGSKTVTLTTGNLPSHSHVIPVLSGTAASTTSTWMGYFPSDGSSNEYGGTNTTSANTSIGKSVYGSGSSYFWNVRYTNSHKHSVSTNTSNTTTCTNCSSTPINVQDPYTVVYMYKRTA